MHSAQSPSALWERSWHLCIENIPMHVAIPFRTTETATELSLASCRGLYGDCPAARGALEQSPHAGSANFGSATSASTPVGDPFAHCDTASPLFGRQLSAPSRAADALPMIQPEDFASPLQSGLRFGVMSRVSPDMQPTSGSGYQPVRSSGTLGDLDTKFKFSASILSQSRSTV